MNSAISPILEAQSASFSTAKFLHPLRVREGRPITIAATAIWAVSSLVLVLTIPDRPVWALGAWALASAWLVIQSLRRTFRTPTQPMPAE